MSKKSKKRDKERVIAVLKFLWFIIKIPYFIVKGILWLIKKISKKSSEIEVAEKRGAIKAEYAHLKTVKTLKGDLSKWENKLVTSDSQIGIILGARGTGKSALGIKLLENIYAKKKSKCFAMGFRKEDLPSWIEPVEDIQQIKPDSYVLIDEGGILFSSRKSMTNANKILSDLILISRHKNLTILFVSQNSANLEINAIRQADLLALKPNSLLQKDFERKKIKEIYDEVGSLFEKYKEDKGLTYIYSNEFKGFISNPLPSFWNKNLSKEFR